MKKRNLILALIAAGIFFVPIIKDIVSFLPEHGYQDYFKMLFYDSSYIKNGLQMQSVYVFSVIFYGLSYCLGLSFVYGNGFSYSKGFYRMVILRTGSYKRFLFLNVKNMLISAVTASFFILLCPSACIFIWDIDAWFSASANAEFLIGIIVCFIKQILILLFIGLIYDSLIHRFSAELLSGLSFAAVFAGILIDAPFENLSAFSFGKTETMLIYAFIWLGLDFLAVILNYISLKKRI